MLDWESGSRSARADLIYFLPTWLRAATALLRSKGSNYSSVDRFTTCGMITAEACCYAELAGWIRRGCGRCTGCGKLVHARSEFGGPEGSPAAPIPRCAAPVCRAWRGKSSTWYRGRVTRRTIIVTENNCSVNEHPRPDRDLSVRSCGRWGSSSCSLRDALPDLWLRSRPDGWRIVSCPWKPNGSPADRHRPTIAQPSTGRSKRLSIDLIRSR